MLHFRKSLLENRLQGVRIFEKTEYNSNSPTYIAHCLALLIEVVALPLDSLVLIEIDCATFLAFISERPVLYFLSVPFFLFLPIKIVRQISIQIIILYV